MGDYLVTVSRTDAQRKAALARMEKMEMEPVAEVLDDEGPITVSRVVVEDLQDPLLKRIKGGRAVERSKWRVNMGREWGARWRRRWKGNFSTKFAPIVLLMFLRILSHIISRP